MSGACELIQRWDEALFVPKQAALAAKGWKTGSRLGPCADLLYPQSQTAVFLNNATTKPVSLCAGAACRWVRPGSTGDSWRDVGTHDPVSHTLSTCLGGHSRGLGTASQRLRLRCDSAWTWTE